MKKWILFVLAVLLLLSCKSSEPSSPSSTSGNQSLFIGGTGKILFLSERDENLEICVMNADVSNQTR